MKKTELWYRRLVVGWGDLCGVSRWGAAFCLQWISWYTWVAIPSAVICMDDILAVLCLGTMNTMVLANGFCSVFLARAAVFAVSQKPTVHKLNFIAIGNSAAVWIKDIDDKITQKYSFFWMVTFQEYKKGISSLARWRLGVLLVLLLKIIWPYFLLYAGKKKGLINTEFIYAYDMVFYLIKHFECKMYRNSHVLMVSLHQVLCGFECKQW